MKKLFLLSFALIGFALTTQAQEIADNAIGLRLGDSDTLMLILWLIAQEFSQPWKQQIITLKLVLKK